MKVTVEKNCHELVEDKQLGLELLQIDLFSEPSLMNNCVHKVGVLFYEFIASDCYHKLKERSDSLVVVAFEESVETDQSLGEGVRHLSVVNFKLPEEVLGNFREGVLAYFLLGQVAEVHDQQGLDWHF